MMLMSNSVSLCLNLIAFLCASGSALDRTFSGFENSNWKSEESTSSSSSSSSSASTKCVSESEFCMEPGCIHTASDILGKIDPNTRPCDDFYKFVCGGWQEKNAHEVNKDNLFYASNLNEMPAEVDAVLEDLISGARKIDNRFYHTKAYSDMKKFYDSCMNADKIDLLGYAPAIETLKSLQEFYVGKPFEKNSWNLTRALTELFKLNGSPFFDISMDTSLNNTRRWSPVVTLPKHYGLIADELFTVPRFEFKRLPNKYKSLNIRSLNNLIRKLSKKVNIESLLLRILSKSLGTDSFRRTFGHLNNFDSDRKSKAKQTKRDHGKPNKFTSFFSRIIETDSVKVENEINTDNFDNKEGFNKAKIGYGNNEKLMNNDIISDDVLVVSRSPLENYNNKLRPNNAISPKFSSTMSGTSASTKPNEVDNDSFGRVPPSVTTQSTAPYTLSTLNAVNSEPPLVLAGNDSERASVVGTHNHLNSTTNFTAGHNASEEEEEAFDFLKDRLNFTHDFDDEEQDLIKNLMEGTDSAMYMLGLTPYLSRQSLYQGIQEELEKSRLAEIRKLLHDDVFDKIFIYSEEDEGESVDSHNATDEEFLSFEALVKKEESILEIISFIAELKEIEPKEREKILAMQEGHKFKALTLNDIQNTFPEVEWKFVLNELLKGPINDSEEVIVFHYEFLEKLFALLRTKDPKVIHFSALTLFTFNVLKELVTVNEDMTRDEFCLAVTKESMNLPLSYMYLKYMGDGVLGKLQEEIMPMVAVLKERAKEMIEETSLLNEKDKSMALLKIEHMSWDIGGVDLLLNVTYIEESYKDLEVRNQDFYHNVMKLYELANDLRYQMFSEDILREEQIWSYTVQPYTINAFYIQTTNAIVLPHAFFKPPYFYSSSPTYVKFGSAGMAFAHEMVHAFDVTGSEYDNEGKRTYPFTPSLTKNIKERMSCFNDMVTDTFSTVERVEGLNVLMTVDNNATMNENFADIVGLDLAYKAFKRAEERANTSQPQMPGLPYSADQLFFISFAQPYCAILPPVAQVILMEIDEHLIHNIRVNSVLMNYPEFQKTFQCQRGDGMALHLHGDHNICPII